MLVMLRDLVQHKGYANASLLRAVREHPTAADDDELRRLLHHIILANRFWVYLTIARPFADEVPRVPDSLDTVVQEYRELHADEWAWLSQAGDADLARALESPFIPGRRVSVAQAWMQVCLHSHGHRAQCATRLRSLGGAPPMMDFVSWLTERRPADWS